MTRLALCCLLASAAGAAETVWNFSNANDRLAAASGPGVLSYFDPATSGWGAQETEFGKASEFGLPAMAGGDADVMMFPALTPEQGYRLVHQAAANGPYGETDGLVSNYTIVMDVLYPAVSDGRWRSLWQTDATNASDAEFFVRDQPGGGIGINGNYLGMVTPDEWHRIAIVVRSAPGEGNCQRFIDGQFVGGIGSTGSALDIRWAAGPELLLFADDNGETAAGYVSSVYFADRALTMEAVQALGKPQAAGANMAGPLPAPLPQQMPRRVGAIGHRGGALCCAPDNTLAAVQNAIDFGLPVIEIDTRLSADGVCVLMHDPTIDRTTNGSGALGSLTVAQLKSFDAGSWFDPSFAGEKIPTAAEVMALAKGELILFFDLKVTGQIAAIQSAAQQTGFDLDECWFWVSTDTSEAQAIRAAVPDAKIVWGDPPADWATDPLFFSGMQALGVYGFDLASYYGTANPAFTVAAKKHGFIVACYTILDPDTMVRNAHAGVDFMETDYGQIMNAIQPPQQPRATAPFPAIGATEVPVGSTAAYWVTGLAATAHRIYLGTTAPPAFLREQTCDLLPLDGLATATTYYWRVDEVTASGTVTGDLWQFTTAADAGPRVTTYEWTFDHADLSAALGPGLMTYADGSATQNQTAFGISDGATVPHISGSPATFLHAPGFVDPANGYHLEFIDSGPNGGGAYINQFTFIADLLAPAPTNWLAIIQTQPANTAGNDADFYVAPDGSVGIGALGYSPGETFQAGRWHRVAFTADLGAGLVNIFVDGTRVVQRTGTSLLDGRFSLFSNLDAGPDLRLFNEGDGTGVYTHEVYLASVALVDTMLGENEIAALGGPKAAGIFLVASLPELAMRIEGSDIILTWTAAPEVRLQRSDSLFQASWQDILQTLGTDGWLEPLMPGSSRFFRLAR